MDNTKLLENVNLCHLSLFKLQEWLKENDLLNKEFTEIKKQWKQELENNSSSFFIDTELLISEKDIILLQVKDENVVEYLAKTYQIKEQQICQKLFGENKNFVLLTKQQWQEIENKKNGVPRVGKEEKNCLILLKDEEIIKSKLANWLENLSQKD